MIQFIIKNGQVIPFKYAIIMVKVNRFILQHLSQILSPYLSPPSGEKGGYNRMPHLDRHINAYFRAHKSLGPSQRRDLYNNTYDIIRYHHYLNHLAKGSTDLEYRLSLMHSSDFYTEMDNNKLAKWIRCSFPKILYNKIVESMQTEYDAFDLCKAMNTRAPLTVRVNPAVTNRGDFLKKISSFLNIQLIKTQISPYGVIIPSNKNIDLHKTEQFQKGHFQVQDQASQICALQVKCRPGDIILDYCSGSGGKSLAIAHLMEGKGQLYLHEPRLKPLQNAKKRFQRAGFQNVQFHQNQEVISKTIAHKADWIILDVPCSGTGTIRRNPDIKIHFNEQTLKHNIRTQEQIFSKSLKYLNKNGKIAYMTCSVLREENQDQVRKFIKQFDMEVVGDEVLKTKVVKGGMDGMFAAVLKRKN